MWKKLWLWVSYLIIGISVLAAIRFGLAIFPALVIMPAYIAAMSTDSGTTDQAMLLLWGGYAIEIVWIVLLILSIITVARHRTHVKDHPKEVDLSNVPKDGRVKP